MSNFFKVCHNMIPVVDCENEPIERKAEPIFRAIQSTGFVYLKNFGFDFKLIDAIFEIGKQFWNLPADVKSKFARSKNYAGDGNSGYVGQNVEILNSASFSEIRESFNFRPIDNICRRVDESVPGFYEKIANFCDQCSDLSLGILRMLAQQLNLTDGEFFTKCHGNGRVSATTLRLLHYPPLPDNIAPDTVRCGDHSDYGSITLLFQDLIGGLEVMNREGEFVKADPIPGTVLINIGDLMQRWTSDRLLAVRHRVLVPENREDWKSERYSMAYFVHPDDDTIIQPLDGSSKYTPTSAGQYLLNMFAKTY